MPIGSDTGFFQYASLIRYLQPKRILDLGIGFGINATPVRNWNDWLTRPESAYIAGVEVWPAYRNPMWDLYDRVDVGLIEESSLLDETWDAIVLTDVIASFDRDAGMKLLRRLQKRTNPKGWIFVSTPDDWTSTTPVDGNVYEVQKYLWTFADFRELGFRVTHFEMPTYGMLTVMWGTWMAR